MKLKPLVILVSLLISAGAAQAQVMPGLKRSAIVCGAERMEAYSHMIKGKSIGLVANPTSRVGTVHLVDTLVRTGIRVKKVFAPEHGFRGEEEAGGTIRDGIDTSTGIPVISLYGSHKKPTPEDLLGLDVVLFDIQDVGVRFYTYISTLHLVMEACAEQKVPLIVLDRPDPNGFYVDGPILDTTYRSFVGMHPVPVVHGMTIGEYAGMINGEHWLAKGVQCDLTVVRCTGWDHRTEYILPVKPSPNLPGQVSVYLYPTTCFFEGTVVSIGRGTGFPFQVYGNPAMTGDFRFTPKSLPGISLHPMYENKECRGIDLRPDGVKILSEKPGLKLEWLIDAWQRMNRADNFFNAYFDTLAGTNQLGIQIRKGMSADEIRATWKPGLDKYKVMREKYLLYD